MASFNKVILIGNLTADPELRQTPTGTSVCRFTIAVNRRNARAESGQQTADFITVVAWNKSAEFVAHYFRKGRPILVCGRIQTGSWTDQQGNKRYTTEVVADEVSFVDSARNEAGSGVPGGQYTPDAYAAPAYSNTASAAGFEELADDDNLPF
jgi:single-strand DNA-binding protein